MSEVMKQSELSDEPLSWLACRYISDEMSDTELDAFESRLNPDSSAFELAACEAVARAVQLNDAVAVASEAIAQPAPQIVGEQTSRRDVVARRVSLVAASVTVLAVTSPLVESPFSSSGKWATRPSVSCAFTLAMPTNMNALNTPAAIKRRAVISFLIMVWLLFGVIVCRLLIIKLLAPIRFRFKLVLLLRASLAFNTDNRQLRDQ